MLRKINQFISQLPLFMVTAFSFCAPIVIANPVGGQVAAGSVVITAPEANKVQINQSSNKAIINWQSFNVSAKEHVQFQQPNASSITLNRVNPQNGASAIYGKITANGQVWLVNPAGIYIGASAYINVGGLVATTANISDQDFMNGTYRFVQPSEWNGAIVNEGRIIIENAGLAALVGNGVVNNGLIEATLGSVVIGAGSVFVINFSGNELIQFTVEQEAQSTGLASGIENTGTISANGGKVLMQAKTASEVLDRAINLSGVTEAKSVSSKNGEIVLMGGEGTVTISNAKMMASGKNTGEKAGNIKITAKKILVADNSVIDVSGDQGGGTILIGGDAHGVSAFPNAQYTYIAKNTLLNANALSAGNGGKVVVWSDIGTKFYGDISAQGGALMGNGGWVETSGKQYLDVAGSFVDTRATYGDTGMWLLDPTNIFIALNQTNATNAGMIGTDSTANYGTTTFQGFGAIQDSLLTTGNLETALLTSNVTVTTTNTPGTGLGNITVVDPITWSNANDLTLTSANNIYINAGITTGTAGAILVLNAVGDVTQTAAIGGSGAVTKQGVGTLVLNQANTYTGVTTISAGTVKVQHNDGLGTTAGGTTIASGASIQIDGSGLVIAEPITSMIGTGVNSAGALQNLANSNEYSGAITLGAGGATIQSVAGALTLSGGIDSATRPLTITGSGNTIINSVIGTTTGTLTKNGSGLLTLTAANTYSGATSVNAGGLTLSGNGTAISTAFSVAHSATLTLDNTGTNNSDRIANALTLTGGEFILLGNTVANTSESVGALTLPSGYSTVTVTPDVGFNTQLTFASLSRTAGAGILFRGTNLGQNTVASQTANNANIVFISAPTLSGAGGNSGTTTVSIIGGAIGAITSASLGTDFVTYNPPTGAVNGLRPLLSFEYTDTPATGVNLKLATNRSANDAFSINSLLLSGGITYDYNISGTSSLIVGAGTTRSGNILSIGNNIIQTSTGGTPGALAFGNAEAKIFTLGNLTLSSTVPVTGTASLTKHGAGTLFANRSVALTGGVRVTSGTLEYGINNAFTTAQAFTVLAPATLNLNGFNQSVTTLTLNSGAISGAAIATGVGTLTLGGTLTLNANGSGEVGASISGNVALGGTTRTFTINDGISTQDLAISAIISDGIAGITKNGNGTLTLSGNNTYSGLTTISAGTLEAAHANALGSIANGTVIASTLLISNAAIGNEAVTLNNGAALSGSGTASLNGNITLGGTAATRTVSALLSSDTLTLGGTIDGLAAALTVSGSGTVVFNNAVGATTALTSITTNAGSILAIDGGGVRTSGAQTYNGAVTMLVNPATFEVTGALSDILMPNVLNNINNTITYAVSGAGSIRDITLANSSSSAVIPTLPSGLRNLSLNFTNAGMALPSLTLTGTLTAYTAGGDLTQSGAQVITGATVLGSGAYDISMTNIGNNFGSISINGGDDAVIVDSNTINLGGAVTAVNTLSVTSGGTITDSNRLSINTLTTSSVGGMTLDFANHTISNFNASNITSGGIALTNTSPLTLLGISQSGGGTTVSITNTGLVSIPDGVTINSGTTLAITATDLNLNTTGAIASGTSTTITQGTTSGSIGLGNTSGTMSISGDELQRISATALSIVAPTDGSIIVDGITSANSANISGTTTLTATAGTLGAISFINNPSSFRTLTVTSDASTIVGANLATTVGALTFTVNTGALSISDAATASSITSMAITANDLNLNTSGALLSTTTLGITNNIASTNIGLGNTAGGMTISGAELQRMTVGTNLTLTNSSDGNIIVDGISVANSANIAGTTTLTATTGTLGTITFINNPSSFRTLSSTSDAGTTVGANLSTSVGALNFTVSAGTMSVSDGATAHSQTSMAITASDLNLNSTGALSSATTMGITNNVASSNIGLGNTAGGMTISGDELQRMTVGTTLTLTNATDGAIIVDGITAANSANISGTTTFTATTGTLGAISFVNNASSFRTLTMTADAGISVGSNISTTVGALNFTSNTSNLSVLDGATAHSQTSMAVTANDLDLNSTGVLSSTTTMGISTNIASGSIGLGNAVGSMSISNSELQRLFATTLTFTTPTNGSVLLDGILTASTANITALTLAANAGIGSVTAQGSSSIIDKPFTITTDLLTVNNGIALATNNQAFTMTVGDINLNSTGSISSGTAAMTITQQNAAGIGVIGLGNAVGSLTLDNTELANITAGSLSINTGSSGGVDGTFTIDGAIVNISGLTTLTATAGTAGAISFVNNSSAWTNALTLSTDNNIVIDDGVTLALNNNNLSMIALDLNLNTTGAINIGNGDLSITHVATGTDMIELGNTSGTVGTMGISGSELQRMIANNLTLTAAGNGQIIVDNITAANSANIAGTTSLIATAGTTGSVVFQNNASSFNALTVTADNNISLTTDVTASAGILSLGSAIINLTNSNLSGVGMTLGTAATNQVNLNSAIALNSNGGLMTINALVDGAQDFTLDAGSGNIILNTNFGSNTRLGLLTIQNFSALTSNPTILVTSYLQSGTNGTANFTNGGLSATGNATLNGTTVDGNINVGSLSLNLSTGNMFGTVNGLSGEAAVSQIVLLNTVLPNTIFFNGFDVAPAVPPTPPVPPAPVVPDAPAQVVFSADYAFAQQAAAQSNVNIGMGGYSGNFLDYEPLDGCVRILPEVDICSMP